MEAAIVVVYLVGWLVTAGVSRHRVGVSQRGRIPASMFFGSFPWVVSQICAGIVWPIVLVVWLARGRPKSPWHAVTTASGTLQIRRRVAR